MNTPAAEVNEGEGKEAVETGQAPRVDWAAERQRIKDEGRAHGLRAAQRQAATADSLAAAGRVMAGATAPEDVPVLTGEVAVPGPADLTASSGGESELVLAEERPDAVALLRWVLSQMGMLLRKHVEFPSRSAVIAVVLWLAQAAARDVGRNSIWYAYPRLLLTSRQNGSGKSSIGDLSRGLLQCRAGRMSKVTPAGLTKVFGVLKEVAILDDAQNVFRSDKAGAELLSVMVNGYTDGATWVTGKGDGKVEPAAGSMLIVGKDSLVIERAETLSDLLARSVIVRLERPELYMPELDHVAIGQARRLGMVLAGVTGALQGELLAAASARAAALVGIKVTDPNGPRTMQIWRPLLAIADVAGGPWPAAAERAREELTAAEGDLFIAADALAALAGSLGNEDDFFSVTS